MRIRYEGNEHPLLNAVMRGLDDAVIVAVPLGVGQVDLAVVESMVNRVAEAYDCLSIDHFGVADPIITDQKCHKESPDTFKHRVGQAVFDSYRREFLRTYRSSENIPSSYSVEVWTWFDNRITSLNNMLGTYNQKVPANRKHPLTLPIANPQSSIYRRYFFQRP